MEEAQQLRAAQLPSASTYKRYNNSWLLQRHGYMTPARAREKFSRRAA